MEQKLVPAYEGKKPYLFVSYAHLDSYKVLPVINETGRFVGLIYQAKLYTTYRQILVDLSEE